MSSQASNVTATPHHRQQANESIADFAARIRQSYDCLSDWGAEYPLRAPVDRFLRGLRVPRCREFVFYRKPKTLEEAVEAAEHFTFVDASMSQSSSSSTSAAAVVSGEEKDCLVKKRNVGSSDRSTTAGDVHQTRSTTVGSKDDTRSVFTTSSLARRLKSAGVDPEIQRKFEVLLHDLGCHQVREYDEAEIERHTKRIRQLELEKTLKYEHSTIVVIEYRGFRVLNLCKVRPAYPLFSIRVRNPKWMESVFNRVKKWNSSITVPSEILG